MTSLFFILSLLGLSYFMVIKRRFDLFSLTYFSAIFYFSPGYVGYVPIYFMAQTEPVAPYTYFIMSLVLGAILCSAITFDILVTQKEEPVREISDVDMRLLDFMVKVLLFVSFMSAIGNFLTIDRSLLAGGVEKTELLENNTPFYNFWVYTSVLALFFSYYLRNYLFFSIALVSLVLDTYFYAMRVHIVLGLMAVIFHWIYSKGRIRLFSRVNYAMLFSPFVLFFFVFKSLMRPLNEGNYSIFFERLFSSETYMYWLVRAEPFNQVAILNKVVNQDFAAPPLHLFMSAVSIIPYSGTFDFGVPQRFHDYFYPVLYPSMKVGAIASNPWAQLLSSGGILMLLCGTILFLSIIYFASVKLNSQRPSVSNLVLLSLAPAFCFYMHRNDLYFTVLLCKRFIIPVLLIYIFRLLVIQFLEKRLS